MLRKYMLLLNCVAVSTLLLVMYITSCCSRNSATKRMECLPQTGYAINRMLEYLGVIRQLYIDKGQMLPKCKLVFKNTVPLDGTIVKLLEPQPTTHSSRVCKFNWPAFELFLPMNERYLSEYHQNLYPSLTFFWPLYLLDIVIVIDSEMDNRESFEIDRRRELHNARSVRFAVNHPSHYYNSDGWLRQQLLMFYADNFTTSNYVGFIDTDTIVISSPDRADLFAEDGKPIFFGKYGVPGLVEGGRYGDWAKAPALTKWAIGRDEVMRSMAHFPVIVKVSHLRRLRHYMNKLHNQSSFNNVFLKMVNRRMYFSQFNIICTYLWHFHRHEYAWRLQVVNGGWHGNPPLGKVRSIMQAGVSRNQLEPLPRVCIHGNDHHDFAGRNLDDMLREGYCYSELKSKQSDAICRSLYKNTIFADMYTFENDDWSWHYLATKNFLRRQRRQNREHCHHRWNRTTLLRLGVI